MCKKCILAVFVACRDSHAVSPHFSSYVKAGFSLLLCCAINLTQSKLANNASSLMKSMQFDLFNVCDSVCMLECRLSTGCR
jgi:hypothetical protein